MLFGQSRRSRTFTTWSQATDTSVIRHPDDETDRHPIIRRNLKNSLFQCGSLRLNRPVFGDLKGSWTPVPGATSRHNCRYTMRPSDGCDRHRTCDLQIKSLLLCQLSYTSMLVDPKRIELLSPGLKVRRVTVTLQIHGGRCWFRSNLPWASTKCFHQIS